MNDRQLHVPINSWARLLLVKLSRRWHTMAASMPWRLSSTILPMQMDAYNFMTAITGSDRKDGQDWRVDTEIIDVMALRFKDANEKDQPDKGTVNLQRSVR